MSVIRPGDEFIGRIQVLEWPPGTRWRVARQMSFGSEVEALGPKPRRGVDRRVWVTDSELAGGTKFERLGNAFDDRRSGRSRARHGQSRSRKDEAFLALHPTSQPYQPTSGKLTDKEKRVLTDASVNGHIEARKEPGLVARGCQRLGAPGRLRHAWNQDRAEEHELFRLS